MASPMNPRVGGGPLCHMGPGTLEPHLWSIPPAESKQHLGSSCSSFMGALVFSPRKCTGMPGSGTGPVAVTSGWTPFRSRLPECPGTLPVT